MGNPPGKWTRNFNFGSKFPGKSSGEKIENCRKPNQYENREMTELENTETMEKPELQIGSACK